MKSSQPPSFHLALIDTLNGPGPVTSISCLPHMLRVPNTRHPISVSINQNITTELCYQYIYRRPEEGFKRFRPTN